MNPISKAYLELHIAVFLFGFTAILGDLISLPALSLVWWRVLFTSFSLVFLIRVMRLFRRLPRAQTLRFMGIGVLVALHWLAFYGAVKLANASIALVAMATTSFFTAFIEPLIMRRRVIWYEIALGLLIIPGMVLVVNGMELSMLTGLGVGFLSAFLAALFATLNKKFIGDHNAMEVTFLELGSAWLFLSLVLPVYFLFAGEAIAIWPVGLDWLYLLVLSLLCTTLAYVLALRALRHLSAFASNLTINLEPVYGIVMAWIILKDHESLNQHFYWGVVIILLAVFSYPLLKKRVGKADGLMINK
ncbi:MAG TPA: DMT family transporter [Saprospiraceae bacterium]|nr:DMT family transporter [Saprospiraceae bacterium]HMP22811.1 DMT family transporter [Saprospiraceae bacterium]